ncbi:hypothetical protein BDZ89DRAFT_1137711 [Hymenopellis radicata]|nr:hypothetical protein BDZ89DRAFT_1137711 [Hymenopellis radicata]
MDVRSYVHSVTPKRLSPSHLAFLSRSLSTVVVPTTASALDVKKKFYDTVNAFFTSISSGLSSGPSSTSELEARLVPMLPDMMKCFVAFNRLYVLEDSPFLVEDDVQMKLLVPFTHLSIHKQHVMHALAEPPFMDCWTRLWARALTTERSSFSLIHLYWTTIRGVAFTAEGERTLTFAAFKGVLDEQPPQLFAHSCIRRLAVGLNELNVRLILLSTITMCSRVSLELCRLFLASDGIKWALVPPHRLITASGEPATPEDIETDFVVTIRFIWESVSIGRLWVAEAIRCGLLERLCDSPAILDSTVPEGVTPASAVVGLINIINSHTIYRPVLKEAHLSVEKLLRTNIEQTMDHTGELWAAWEALKTTVSQRWLAKKRHVDSCGNKSVTSSLVRHNLSHLSPSAFPCLKLDCVAAAVVVQLTTVDEPARSKAGRMTTNQNVRHGKWNVEVDGHANPPNGCDLEFLNTIVDHDLQLCKAEMPNLVIDFLDRRHSTVYSPAVLRIDYVAVPRTIEITVVEHLQDCEGWETYEGWKKHGELKGKIYVRIPDGTRTFITGISTVPV